VGYGQRAIWAIALPMIISNLSVPLVGLVDTAVMGHQNQPEYLAAVTIGATVFSFIFMGLNFIRMGTTGVAAQAIGRGDGTALRTVLGQALLLAATLGALLIVLQGPLAQLALTAIAPEIEVGEFAQIYIGTRIWGAVATLGNFALIGWFLGAQNARAPLFIMLTTNIANIGLDLLFVVGLDMNIAGVALASVLGETGGFAVGLLMVARELSKHPGSWSRQAIVDWAGVAKLARINTNIFIRTLALMFTFGFMTAWGARLGTTVLAVNGVLMNFQHLMSYGLDGLAHAAEALVGKAVGAGQRPAVRAAVRGTLAWSVLFGFGFTAVFALTGTGIVAALTNLDSVRQAAEGYLPWLILLPLVSLWSFAYDGIFIGATRAKEMRNAMMFSTVAVFLPACYLFSPLGNHGLWLAFTLFMLSRAITMAWLWRRLEPSLIPVSV
jgi:MATE family multidrug resistance protein